MAYIDGFLTPVPVDKKDAYKTFAEKWVPILKDLGALSTTECWGDDVPDGEVTSFPMAVKQKEGETVVFSWTVWPDKATRDAGWAKMMEDPRMKELDMSKAPFDGKRLMFGGFEVLVEN
ncbi:MAG: DUF1428 domain-containing protein [Pseudomonadota bacterium]